MLPKKPKNVHSAGDHIGDRYSLNHRRHLVLRSSIGEVDYSSLFYPVVLLEPLTVCNHNSSGRGTGPSTSSGYDYSDQSLFPTRSELERCRLHLHTRPVWVRIVSIKYFRFAFRSRGSILEVTVLAAGYEWVMGNQRQCGLSWALPDCGRRA